VFVTDKDGRAVPGLTQADFEVEDPGRGVAVAGFLAVDAGAPAALIRDDGQALPLEAAESRVVDDADGFRRFVVSVTRRTFRQETIACASRSRRRPPRGFAPSSGCASIDPPA
jgi:hypothetical protein